MSEFFEFEDDYEDLLEGPEIFETEEFSDQMGDHHLGEKLGESDEQYWRKKQAEAEAKGLEVAAKQYKEKADAAAIYEKIK
jgi:hypothetical protein